LFFVIKNAPKNRGAPKRKTL